jgi:formyltetrahydrofolate synthetase
LVSILLGVITTILGLAGIVGFMHIKEGVDVKTQVAVNENKNQLDQKIKEIEKDTNKHFEALSKKYFEDGGQASKIIARSVAQELDKNKTEIEDEDEEELN